MFPRHVAKLVVPKMFTILVKGFHILLVHPLHFFSSQARWHVLFLLVGHAVGHCFNNFFKTKFWSIERGLTSYKVLVGTLY